MVRTFLQVAAGAADIPVTRFLGQSPAGMSATGESDTRNYYDMIAARQAIDLRPKLERLDELILRSAGVDPAALSFEFRPLWQMDAAASATIALQKAQATQIYAGLNLWPAAVTARLVQSQLVEDGIYPGAEGIFAEAPAALPTADFDPAQPRDPDGRWTAGGGSGGSVATGWSLAAEVKAPVAPRSRTSVHPKGPAATSGLSSLLNLFNPIGTASAQEIEPEEENQGLEQTVDPAAEARIERYVNARNALREIDPKNTELETLSAPDYVPTEQEIARLEAAARTALAAKADLGPPSESLPANPATRAPIEPADDQDPYKNQDIPFDRSNLEDKIKNYLLDSVNRNNKGKAGFFESNLGFNAENWDQLADQIDFKKSEAVFDPKRTDNYGNVYYNQAIRVVGANGRSMTLNGGFAIQNGKARLTTLLPD